jgi:hypothetical protein
LQQNRTEILTEVVVKASLRKSTHFQRHKKLSM